MIVHLTSVHSRYDTRIFFKECRSLSKAGYQVGLIVADGKGDEIKDGVSIFDVGLTQNRFNRMLRTTRKIFKKAIEIDAKIYHLHDPELIPLGLKLKKVHKKVFFDSHEDLPNQILGKHYLYGPFRSLLSRSLALCEKLVYKNLDGIIAATPFIREKFLNIHYNVIDVNNFPIYGELEDSEKVSTSRKKQVCYVGAIGTIRGIKEMVKAMEIVRTDVRLVLGGRFYEKNLVHEIKKVRGWASVDELGWLDRVAIRSVLNTSVAGMVTLHPIVNYLDSLPVKMFEYMSAGLPVIASNFPLWKEIVEGNDCGLCVDPLNPKAIAEAIDFFVENPNKGVQMGKNGQKAVKEKYNWSNECIKLLRLYEQTLEA